MSKTTTSSQKRQLEENFCNTLIHRNKQLYQKGIELDDVLRSKDQSLKETVLEIKDNLEKLILAGATGYEYPVNAIFSVITNTFHKMGMSDNTLKRIYDIFSSDDYNKYKLHLYHHKLQQAPTTTTTNTITTPDHFSSDNHRNSGNDYNNAPPQNPLSLGEINATKLSVQNCIAILKSNPDHPDLLEFKRSLAIEDFKRESKQRREKKESEKIKIPLPDWVDKEAGGADSETCRALIELSTVVKECANRVYRWPPGSDEDDKYYSDGIRILSKLFEPGTDAKFTRDTLSYFDIAYERYSQSDHSAKSKSKMITSTGDLRGMTREHIAAIAEKYLVIASQAIEHIPGLFHFMMYLRTDQKPFNAQWHVDLHPKLSESAFGNSSLYRDIDSFVSSSHISYPKLRDNDKKNDDDLR